MTIIKHKKKKKKTKNRMRNHANDTEHQRALLSNRVRKSGDKASLTYKTSILVIYPLE